MVELSISQAKCVNACGKTSVFVTFFVGKKPLGNKYDAHAKVKKFIFNSKILGFVGNTDIFCNDFKCLFHSTIKIWVKLIGVKNREIPGFQSKHGGSDFLGASDEKVAGIWNWVAGGGRFKAVAYFVIHKSPVNV